MSQRDAALCLAIASVVLMLGGCRDSNGEIAPERAVPRVVLIGLDAADPKIVHRLLRSGKMPNLDRVARAGGHGRLKTVTLDPHGGATMQWTSFATGRRADQHEVLSEYANRPDKYGYAGPMQTGHRKVPALWNVLGDAGVRVGVAGWPVTWPAESVNGYMASHYLKYRSPKFDRATTLKGALQLTFTGTTYANSLLDQTHPPEFYDVVEPFIHRAEAVGDSEIFRVLPSLKKASNRIFYDMKWAYVANEIVRQVGSTLIEDRSLDFVSFILHGMDPAAHRAGKVVSWKPFRQVPDPELGGLVDEYYGYIDDVVGSMLDRIGDDTIVILASQHGTEGGRHAKEAIDGILTLRGPGIRQGVVIRDAGLLDLYPTLLYLYRLPIPRDLEGRILTELFTEEIQLSRTPHYVDAPYGSAETIPLRNNFWRFNPEITKRTDAIGYRTWSPGASEPSP